jgi:hypothetical protein
MRIAMPQLLQDFLQWKPDVAFLIGLWTGVVISYIVMKVTARLIYEYDLQPPEPLAVRLLRERVCHTCGHKLEKSIGGER